MEDEYLAGWLRAVELEPGSERQSAIAEGAKAVAAEASPASVLGLVLLAHTQPDVEAYETLRGAISNVDQTFGCRIDDLETHLAAAVCVAEVLERNALVASNAGHAVLSAEWSGLVSPVGDLPVLARQLLAKRSEAHRARGPINVTAALPAIAPFPDDASPVTHQEAQAFSATISTTLAGLKKATESLGRKVNTRLSASDEEMDILWWAFSGFSDLEQKPWGNVSDDGAAAILIAMELAKLIRFPVEPLSVRSVIARLLGERAEREVVLSSAVTGTGKRDLPMVLPEAQLLSPVLSCLSEYKALDGKVAWMESVERWSINPKATKSCLDLATQTVREILLNTRPQ